MQSQEIHRQASEDQDPVHFLGFEELLHKSLDRLLANVDTLRDFARMTEGQHAHSPAQYTPSGLAKM